MPRIDPNTLELEERVVKTNKCQKTHKGGRTLSWNALVVVGDGHGHVGAAIGKARGIPDAIRKGFESAKKELIRVPLAGQTIPHRIQSHHGASIVLLKPASPGTGVVAGGSMRHILEAAGVRDVIGKSLGSANAINTAWATLKALQSLRSPAEVARLRGAEEELTSSRNGGNANGGPIDTELAAGEAENAD
jgi:small subunit ribosomal protein S5